MSKVALVTGASRGIGAAIAKLLQDKGFTVIGTATSESGAENISTALGGKGGVVLNVTDSAQVKEVLGQIEKDYGKIEVLVNNAGITKDNLMLRLSEDDWQSVIDTNLSAIFRLSKTVLKGMMKNRWGRIINIGSVVGTSGNPGQANYCAAKAGVIGFSKSLAAEIASRNVTVNVVAPGFIETDMTAKLPAEQKEALLGVIPMGRMGQPGDIAAAVAFLASDEAAYITGQTIHVNGGMTMV